MPSSKDNMALQSSLDQKKNVDDGIRSLLQGVSGEELSGEHNQNDIEGVMPEETPFHFE